MKKNLIIYTISLMLILASVIAISFAWFTNNKEAEADGNDIAVGDIDGTYSIEAYIDEKWTTPEEILFEEIFPGDTMYFRLKIEAKNAFVMEYQLEGISMSINGITYKDGGIYFSDEKIYDVVDNKVSVTINDEEIDLYTISDDTINLNTNYTLDKVLKLYNLGVSAEPIISKSGDELDLGTKVENVSIAKGECYYYFAIDYPEGSNDNYYQFQRIKIDHIKINEA